MSQVAAGLFGVVLGAVVSETLRALSERRRRSRELQARLRLIGDELAMTGAILSDSELAAEAVRARVAAGLITTQQWLAHQSALAEVLSEEEWEELSGCYIVVRLLLDEPSDDELLKSARLAALMIEKVAESIWTEDRGRGKFVRAD